MNQSDPQAQPAGFNSESLAGKYLTFRLADESYALEIQHVREIIGLMEITKVPKAARWLKGVINLRGRVIPVVDLRLKFEMKAASEGLRLVIIVVQFSYQGREVTIGILVDEVLEVLAIKPNQIEPPPSVGDTEELMFVIGVGKTEERIVFLLDIPRILTSTASQAVAFLMGN